ncbi:hypothetical protein RB195_023571 [Necator americanus]|uniref:Uncharacterized protein n=1 Tax=Necator americanus TaxID=51031 RepID=A0ABR1EJQ7_NECAM
MNSSNTDTLNSNDELLSSEDIIKKTAFKRKGRSHSCNQPKRQQQEPVSTQSASRSRNPSCPATSSSPSPTAATTREATTPLSNYDLISTETIHKTPMSNMDA